MVVHCELDLFYETLVVSGFSKLKGLKVNPCHAPSHYVNGQLHKFDDLKPLVDPFFGQHRFNHKSLYEAYNKSPELAKSLNLIKVSN